METGTVRIRIADPPPPPRPRRRLPLAAGVFIVLALALGAVLWLAERRPGPEPAPSPVAARAGETLELLDGPVGADGKVLDPVTRQEVDPATAPYQADLYGTTFYFGSRDSFDRFREDPLRYVKARVKVHIQLQPGDPASPVPEGTEGLPTEPGPAPEATGAPAPGGGEQWSEPTEPPPTLQGGAEPPTQASPVEPGWLPGDPGAEPKPEFTPTPAAPPPVQAPGDDVIVTPVSPAGPTPAPDDGDVILEPGPAGSPTPLRR